MIRDVITRGFGAVWGSIARVITLGLESGTAAPNPVRIVAIVARARIRLPISAKLQNVRIVRGVYATVKIVRGVPVAGSVTTLYTDTITMYKGDDVSIPVLLPTGTNATGWTVAFRIATAVGATALVTKTITPTGSTLTGTLAAADTSSLPTGDYVYSFRRTDSGSVTTLAQGKLSLYPVA